MTVLSEVNALRKSDVREREIEREREGGRVRHMTHQLLVLFPPKKSHACW